MESGYLCAVSNELSFLMDFNKRYKTLFIDGS